MTKEEVLRTIKFHAKEYNRATLFFDLKGENQAAITLPEKEEYESWGDYLNRFELEPRGEGEWLMAVKIGYRGSVNILFDHISEL